MATEVDGIEIPINVKMDEFDRRMTELERKMDKTGERAKAKGKGIGNAFLGGIVGGAVGFVAGAATHNPAMNAVTELLINIIAAALLPLMQALLPVLQVLLPVLIAIGEKLGATLSGIVGLFGPDSSAGILAGAAIGTTVAGPVGGVVGGAAGGAAAEGKNLYEQTQLPPEERTGSQFGNRVNAEIFELIIKGRNFIGQNIDRIVGIGLV